LPYKHLKQLIGVCERRLQDILSQKRPALPLHSRNEITSDHETQAVRKSVCCKEACGPDRGTQKSGGIQGNVEQRIQLSKPGSDVALSLPPIYAGKHKPFVLYPNFWSDSKIEEFLG